MNKENKYTSLKLSKKIYELTEKKGIELESEYCWGKPRREKAVWVLVTKIKNGNCDWDYIPALDTAEWGEIIPGNIEGYIFQMQKGMLGNIYYCTMVGIDNKMDKEVNHQELAEAMGKMYFYLLDNSLI